MPGVCMCALVYLYLYKTSKSYIIKCAQKHQKKSLQSLHNFKIWKMLSKIILNFTSRHTLEYFVQFYTN